MRELKEPPLIKESELQCFPLNERADLAALERGDLGAPLELAQLPDR